MKKEIIIYVMIGAFITLATIWIVFLYKIPDSNVNESEKNSILLQYGDNIKNISCLTLNEDKQSLINESGYSIIFYIDPYCESCLQSFVLAKEMNDILDESIDIKIMWKQKPNKDVIEKIGITEEEQFILDNTKISNPYPIYFIVDNKGDIIFIVDELTRLSRKVVTLDCMENDKIIELANQYFLKKSEQDNNKPILVYFAMEGCKDCTAVEELLKSQNAQKYYNIITVYTEDSYGEKEFADVGKLFMEIYGIDWYPSFVILKEDTYKFLDESSIEELKKILF